MDMKKKLKARMAHLALSGKKVAQSGLTHAASGSKKAVQATNKQFKDTVDNGIVMPAAKKVNSSPKMPTWAENYVEKLLTGEEKDDIEYE